MFKQLYYVLITSVPKRVKSNFCLILYLVFSFLLSSYYFTPSVPRYYIYCTLTYPLIVVITYYRIAVVSVLETISFKNQSFIFRLKSDFD